MWDDAIDEVARALTEARPSADVKARVMARIHDARAREPWQHWWVWSPAAVAMVLMLAVVFRAGWRAQPTEAPPALAGRTIAPPSASLPALLALETIPATTAIGRRMAVAARAVRADSESTVAPLPPLIVERLNLERVQLKTVPAPEAIALKTLDMTPLELAPLTPERPKAEGEKDDTTLVRPRRNPDAGGRISLRSGDTTSATDT
jgi:hypothetical protein